MKRKKEDMEVEQGRVLASALISMEELYREQKEKAVKYNDDAVALWNSAGRAKKEKDCQAEIIVHSAVVTTAKVHDDIRNIISRPFEQFFYSELAKLQLEKMKLIENLVFQEREFQQYTGEFIRALCTLLCEHFSAKEVAYKIIAYKIDRFKGKRANKRAVTCSSNRHKIC